MKKYYCKDGQEVYVKPADDKDNIIVIYKGKEYIRKSSIINVTLFENKPLKIKTGCFVDLISIVDGTSLKIYISETKTDIRYIRSGGSYYGNSVVIEKSGENTGQIYENGAIAVSEYSPVGKAVIGKYPGDIIEYETPEKIIERYRIIDVHM